MERFLPGISCWLMSSSGMPAITRTRLARPRPAAREPPQLPGFVAKIRQSLGEFLGSGPRGLGGSKVFLLLTLSVLSSTQSFFCSVLIFFFLLISIHLALSLWFLRVSLLLGLLPSRSQSPSLSLSVLFFLGGSPPAESVCLSQSLSQ